METGSTEVIEVGEDIQSSNPAPKQEEGGCESTATIDASKIPMEIIFDILSRLPVKSLLQFRCVSKLWCSLIRDSSFAHLHLTRSINGRLDSFALFISAYNKSTSERHLLSASHRGGHTTHLLTLPNSPSDPTESEHLNGLVLFRCQNGFIRHNFAYLCNPSTREIFKLPGKAAIPRFAYGNAHICYMFGFDQSTDEYKVLNTRLVGLRSSDNKKIECGIFSLKTYSWRKIEPVFPFDITGDDWFFGFKRSVCVNGVIHLMLSHSAIASFDLREEKFSTMRLPPAAIPSQFASPYGVNRLKLNRPYLIQINGLLAVICHDRVVEQNTMEMWILEDYQNQVWVKETITFPAPWVDLDSPFPSDTIHTGEIMLMPRRKSRDRLCITFYDRIKRSFRLVEITLFPEWLSSAVVDVGCVRGYIESILSLRRNDQSRSRLVPTTDG